MRYIVLKLTEKEAYAMNGALNERIEYMEGTVRDEMRARKKLWDALHEFDNPMKTGRRD